jgi:hypothetical protein
MLQKPPIELSLLRFRRTRYGISLDDVVPNASPVKRVIVAILSRTKKYHSGSRSAMSDGNICRRDQQGCDDQIRTEVSLLRTQEFA